MTKQDKILIYAYLTAFTLSYIIYNKWSKSILYNEMLQRIGTSGIKYDDLKIWNRSFLLDIEASGRPYAKYKQDYLKSKSEDIKDSLKGLRGLGTDRDTIIGVFINFNSKIGLAQLVNFYNAKYNRSLKADLESEFRKSTLQQIGTIVSAKPDVIFI